jgi:hypothetical protein
VSAAATNPIEKATSEIQSMIDAPEKTAAAPAAPAEPAQTDAHTVPTTEPDKSDGGRAA